ncbi:serine hydrolase [Maribacter luteus]|uniref:serine hydrolase n=1 Tax=Maribacter luteus TaxID=2594478 RepID=UPI002490D336|nr:serine hydrolase [Maribacter luteus]
MTKKLLSLLCLFSLISACEKKPQFQNALDYALNSNDPRIKNIIDSVQRYEVQIKFTKINRTKDSVIFEDHGFQVNSNNYFYPASTVKLPIAVLALEKLNKLDALSRDTHYYVEGDTIETTFAADITKIFVVSDNAANNRLIEFLGQDFINKSLKEKGLDSIRISHRLSTDEPYEITTKPLIVYLNDSTTTMLEKTVNTSAIPLKLNGIKKGIGYYEENELIHEPFDFGLKNHYPINAQHNVLKRLIFPNCFKENERFDLSSDQREFLLKTMQLLPKEAGYDSEEFYDSYVKFFMFGDKKSKMPENIDILNKVGYAYGTLTDCAYINDRKNNVEFLLTATLLVNSNQIFNDNTYEYDHIGIPFLAALGQEIHSFEVSAKNK